MSASKRRASGAPAAKRYAPPRPPPPDPDVAGRQQKRTAAHAAEGDLVKRSTEAFIVHHADFMSYEPFKNLK